MGNSLRFLSYNTHLFDGGMIGAFLPTYRDQERAELIAGVLERSGADVIGLSEVWPDDLAERIIHRLRGQYHHYRPPTPDLKPQTSGLLLLSKTPFVDHSCGFQPFRHLASPDDMANKGVAWGLSEVTVGGRELKLLMFITHTQADYTGENHLWERQRNIEKVNVNIQNLWLDHPKAAVVLLGDLNVVAEDRAGAQTPEYEQTIAHLEDLKDVYRRVFPDAQSSPGYTYDGEKNSLISRFAEDEVKWRQRVDYHFAGGPLVRDGSLRASIPSASFTFQADGKIQNLSDHEPLITEWSP